MPGFTGLKGDSGDFTSEDNKMSKAGSPYLRYYLGEAETASGSTSLNMLISMPENMLR